jgi:hypothetical protein
MSPLTKAGEAHGDLLGYVAFLVRDALDRGARNRGRGFKARLDSALEDALGYEAEWIRQRASMFKRELDIEKLRRRPLFSQTTAELLTAHVPVDPLSLDPLDLAIRRQPLHALLGGLSTGGGLVAESEVRAGAALFHVPTPYIPWLETWHADQRRSERELAGILRGARRMPPA